MNKTRSDNKSFIVYLVKFALCFCILYYGTIAYIGLVSPSGKIYSPFFDHYLNYVKWFTDSLLYGARFFLSLFGYEAHIILPNHLRCAGVAGVNIGYDCLGYGVSSFWIAFVFANKGSVKRKILWMAGGVFAIWCINILRISLLVMAIFNSWKIPFFEHHTWFNIFAYILIFVLIYSYDRSSRRKRSDLAI
jgi:exosortase/archaeosortase family protein